MVFRSQWGEVNRKSLVYTHKMGVLRSFGLILDVLVKYAPFLFDKFDKLIATLYILHFWIKSEFVG